MLNYASPGVGANSHLYFERFQFATGHQLTHNPYKGIAAALADRLSGRIPLTMSGQDVKPMIDSGKLTAIAITGPERGLQCGAQASGSPQDAGRSVLEGRGGLRPGGIHGTRLKADTEAYRPLVMKLGLVLE